MGSAHLGAERNVFYAGIRNMPKATKWSRKDAKMNQGTTQNTPLRNRVEKVRKMPCYPGAPGDSRCSRCYPSDFKCGTPGAIQGNHFHQKSLKIQSEKSSNNQSAKNVKFDTQRLPTLTQNRCKNSSTNHAKTWRATDAENQEQSSFSGM